MTHSMDRRSFLASAGVIASVGAFKEEHELQGGEVLRIQKGDILLFHTDRRLPWDAIDSIRESAQRTFGDDYQVVVMTEGLKLSVLRPEP